MLRITIHETPDEQRFVLEGKLIQPCVSEIESAWERTQKERRGRRCVIDLRGATAIDQSGKRVLTLMSSEGAQFLVKGVATMHLIEDIEQRRAESPPNVTAPKQ